MSVPNKRPKLGHGTAFFKKTLMPLVFCLVSFVFISFLWAQDSFFVSKVNKVLSGGRVMLRGGTVIDFAAVYVADPNDNRPALKQFGKAAFSLNQSLLEGKQVRFEFLENEEGPKQAFVFVGGSMLNARLLKEGLAVLREDVTASDKYYDYLVASQKTAMQARRGIWSMEPKG